MYQEAAVEVFYPNAYFDFYQDDLRVTLSFLRDVIPRKALARIRRIRFTMTPGRCEGWADGALACGYPEAILQSITRVYCAGNSRPALDYKTDWRAVLGFLARNAHLPRLSLSVGMAECSWGFVDDPYELNMDTDAMFRFMYDFIIDVVAAMCGSLKTLRAVKLDMCLYEGMAGWLEREVLGHDDGEILPLPTSRGGLKPYWSPPPWHDLDQRLEGSNYTPDI